MQSASDIFLGWTRGANGRDFYLCQLRDTKIGAIIEDWDFDMLRAYTENMWVGSRAGACPLGRRRHDFGLDEVEWSL
jgi:hypothetical protein